jgi:uncharacterized protein YndB with AHSA1/START domain
MSTIGSARGTVEPGEDGRGGVRLVFRRELEEPVDEVWAAVTEPDRLSRWIGTWTGEARPGATVLFTMTAEGAVDPEPVTIVACDPPHGYVVDMPDVMDREGPSWRYEVALEALGTGTVLTFVHHLSDPSVTGDMGVGWQYYLDRLAAALADGPMPEWEPYLGLRDHYAAPGQSTG